MTDVVLDEINDTVRLECGVLRTTARTFRLGEAEPGFRALVLSSDGELILNAGKEFPGGVKINDISEFTFRPGYKLEGISEIRGGKPPQFVVILPPVEDPISDPSGVLIAGAGSGFHPEELPTVKWAEQVVVHGDLRIEQSPPGNPGEVGAGQIVSLQAIIVELRARIDELEGRIAALGG